MKQAIAGLVAGIVLGACGFATYQLIVRVSLLEANMVQIVQYINAQQPAKQPQKVED